MWKRVDSFLVEALPVLWLMPTVAALKTQGHPCQDVMTKNQWWLQTALSQPVSPAILAWHTHQLHDSLWFSAPVELLLSTPIEANTPSKVFRKLKSLMLRDVVGLGASLEGSSLEFSARTQCVQATPQCYGGSIGRNRRCEVWDLTMIHLCLCAGFFSALNPSQSYSPTLLCPALCPRRPTWMDINRLPCPLTSKKSTRMSWQEGGWVLVPLTSSQVSATWTAFSS